MPNRTDNFNRADSSTSMGTPSDGGSAWSVQSGTWGIISNRGYYVGSGSQSTAVLESSLANVEVQVTFSSLQAETDLGFCLRSQDDNNHLVMALNGSGGVAPRLFTKIGGSFTLVTADNTPSGTVANGDVWKVSLNGSAIEVFQNGTSRGQWTSSQFSTNTKHGLRWHASALEFDDFSITEIGGGGPLQTVRTMHQFLQRA